MAGCATGEEVYSLAITALETMRRLGIDLRIQIFGTDVSAKYDRAMQKIGIRPGMLSSDVGHA